MREDRLACAASDSPPPGTFEAIYAALEASSLAVIGPARPRLLVIPIRDDNGFVVGGLWGCTVFEWLHVQMLFVPEPLRGRGVGAALMASAESEARARGCRGAYVDTFSFQAAPFYRKIGFTLFGKLDDCPPGHDRLYLHRRFDGAAGMAASAGRHAARPAATARMPHR
ncbi:MAG TPA: GNAT family N-acetyltransferase [Acetobacteraceae bacterium]|nr:GNAT family N-acetyltransferase [Acetobacteraceae bacterium]